MVSELTMVMNLFIPGFEQHSCPYFMPAVKSLLQL